MPADPTLSVTPPTAAGAGGWRSYRRQTNPDLDRRPGPGRVDLSPLGVARTAFQILTTEPSRLAVDTRGCPGLPNRDVALDELRWRLLSASCPPQSRDIVWRRLVTHSRIEGGSWTVACVGLALPALTRMAADLSERFAGDPSDVHAEILTAFLAALGSVNLDRPGVMTRLRWAAYRGGHAAVREALAAPMPCGDGYRSAEPPAPSGHPDLVLARAVGEGVITTVEADLIGATRLEHRRMRDWARGRGVGYEAVKKIRQRGERRLVDWLVDQARVNDGFGGRFVRRANPSSAAPDGSGAGLRLISGGGAPRRVSPIRDGAGFQGCGTTLHPTSQPSGHPVASSEDPRCA